MTLVDSPVPDGAPALARFWDLAPAEREEWLMRGIAAAHTYHFERNTAYRSTVAARGVEPWVTPSEMQRLPRTTVLAFKSYADVLGTRFAQDEALGFVDWLAEQISLDLGQGARRVQSSYTSLEGLLRAVERCCSRQGLEMLTSRGTTGPVAVIPRNARSSELTAQSLSLSFRRYIGLDTHHTALFMMPKRTRVALDRMATLGVRHLGPGSKKPRFTVFLPAYPDGVRVRAGRWYRSGWRGVLEKYVSHPVMSTLESRLVDARAVETTLSRLLPAGAHGEKTVVLGSLDRLHRMASFLLDAGRTMTVAPGSVLVSCGGGREAPQDRAVQMRGDILRAFTLPDDSPVDLRDVYGMAEANWVAVQCPHGNYHIPPWVHAVTLDDREAFQTGPRSTGLLAFFDPFGGGELFPGFFRSRDRVTLVSGGDCACGEPGSYLEKDSIRRVDVAGGAGHAVRP